MQNQLIELQTQLAFQEDTIQKLNDVVTQQQNQIDALSKEIEFLRLQCKEVIAALGQDEGDEKPPHY